jgi:acylphosphatase
VQNSPDGKVQVLAQGSKEAIEKLIKFCEKGPFLSEVKTVDAAWEEEQELFEDFKTIR